MIEQVDVELVEKADIPSEARLPTIHGEFRIRIFHEANTGLDHVALTLGKMDGPDPVLVRIHSECLTGDVLGSVRCDCGRQLNEALDRIQKKGWGTLLYLRQEGRGIGLHAKIQAYHLQDEGADTLEANLMLGLPADARNYRIAAEMLSALKVEAVNLLSNNPDKENQLSEHGIKVVERTPWVVGVVDDNRGYLQTKANRMGHEISEKDLK